MIRKMMLRVVVLAAPLAFAPAAHAQDYYSASDVNAAAVPEPAAWAMLIAGFGFAGLTLRRRLMSGTRKRGDATGR